MTTEVERITIAPRLTRQQVAHELGVTPKTVQNWTAKGLLSAETWESPGGRLYLDYDASEVARLKADMGLA